MGRSPGAAGFKLMLSYWSEQFPMENSTSERATSIPDHSIFAIANIFAIAKAGLGYDMIVRKDRPFLGTVWAAAD